MKKDKKWQIKSFKSILNNFRSKKQTEAWKQDPEIWKNMELINLSL